MIDAYRLVKEGIGQQSAAAIVSAASAEGRQLPGFGLRLYPDGDPRAPILLDCARAVAVEIGGPAAEAMHCVEELLATAKSQGLPPPNLDLA